MIIATREGKALDTGRTVAMETDKTMIIVPTISSTYTSTSVLSAIRTEPYLGGFLEYKF